MKNYIGIVRDHSVSMDNLRVGAAKDYNAQINAIKEASIAQAQDSIVSVVKCGVGRQAAVEFESVNSSITALRPMGEHAYVTDGHATPLLESVGQLIDQLSKVPDASDPSVSFLVMVITDGGENASRSWSKEKLAAKIAELNRTDRWTFVFRVPRGYAQHITRLGIPAGNVLEWDQTERGLKMSEYQTTKAVDTFYKGRAMGQTMSASFYQPDLNGVSTKEIKKSLPDVTSQVKFFDVGPKDNKKQIRDFVEEKTKQTLPLGAAFYQLTKKENEVQESKLLAVRDKRTSHVFSSSAARDVLGIPHSGTVKLVPGDHGNFDIFVQSKSVNRHLIAGTQVMYWPNMGRAT